MVGTSTEQKPLPTQASVVVIGGGVMGCSTLYHLAQAGVGDAILLERNQLTSGTTWHSAAQVRALRSSRNLTDLIRYSVDLYSRLEAETGQMTGWINKGSISIATTPDRMIHIQRQEALAKLYGIRTETISADEALERWPLMRADDVIGAVWSPDDGRVSPSDLCAALVKGAKSNGARVFENTGVTGILTKNGRVYGVETPQGVIQCDAIALCTGLWSREAGTMAGAEIPVWPCEHFYLLTKPIEGISGNMPTLSDHDSHLYIRDDSGGLLVGCFEPMGKPIDPDRIGPDFAFQLLQEDWDHFEPMMINALHRLPALETAEVKMLLNGPESFTPDGSFLLGETAETQGLYLGCGMNSVGVATGGGAGMALARCIAEGAMPMDLHEADPKRFPACFNSAEALTARSPEVLGKHYEITYPHRQMETARHLRPLPLSKSWQEAKAHFGQVFGWERPLYFGKITEPKPTFGKPDWLDAVAGEVQAAHEAAAVFDSSGFGKIDVKGPDAMRFLDRICSNSMDRPVGRAAYTLMLNPKGGIESDLTVFRLSEDHFRLYVGTGAIKRDLAWLRHNMEGEGVQLQDVTEDYAVLGLMGPNSPEVLKEISAEDLLGQGYFHVRQCDIQGLQVTAARLSYVGEYGWEITCKADQAEMLYALLNKADATPAGAFAQTSMRIEKQFLSYGHDIDTDSNPFSAGLAFALAWDTEFIGKDALIPLQGKSPQTVLASLSFDDADAWPLGNEPVYAGGDIIGQTTSAAFGYRVQRHIALASIDAHYIGQSVEVDIAGNRFTAEVLGTPAFDPNGTRMRKLPAISDL